VVNTIEWAAIVAAAAAVIGMIGVDDVRTVRAERRAYTYANRWKFYESVATVNNTEILIQANWSDEAEPSPDQWKFRAAQRGVGKESSTPFFGKTRSEWIAQFPNEPVGDLDPNQWGVPLDIATEGAQARIDALQGVSGGITPEQQEEANSRKDASGTLADAGGEAVGDFSEVSLTSAEVQTGGSVSTGIADTIGMGYGGVI
jgi:hypothetical protein